MESILVKNMLEKLFQLSCNHILMKHSKVLSEEWNSCHEYLNSSNLWLGIGGTVKIKKKNVHLCPVSRLSDKQASTLSRHTINSMNYDDDLVSAINGLHD